jgi:hypothetical protein
MSPAAGKMLKDDDSVFDLTSLLASISSYLAGSGIPVNTELVLNGDVMVSNIKVGSTDGGTTLKFLCVDADGHSQVDVLSSALPSGAATEATLLLAEAHLGNIDTATDGVEALLTTIDADTSTLAAVDFATSAKQDTGNAALAAIQAAVEILDNIVSGSEAQVDVVSSALPTGAATEATLGTLALETGGNLAAAKADLDAIKTAIELIDNAVSGSELQVDIVSSALPTGASTEAKQDTGNTSLGSLDTKLGEVQASPTANTVLGRLKDIADALGALDADVTDKPQSDAAYCPDNDDSAAYEASTVVKAAAGTLFELTGYNSKATDQFIQVHDASSLPSDTAIPTVVFVARAQSNFSWSGGKYGKKFTTGIVVCNSSVAPTKTIGSADCWFNVQYK